MIAPSSFSSWVKEIMPQEQCSKSVLENYCHIFYSLDKVMHSRVNRSPLDNNHLSSPGLCFWNSEAPPEATLMSVSATSARKPVVSFSTTQPMSAAMAGSR